MDSELEFSVDPYDLLQEHDLQIQRLIKAHNQHSKWLQTSAAQAEQMASIIATQSQQIEELQIAVRTLQGQYATK